MIAAAEPEQVSRYVSSFADQGYAHFRNIYSAAQVDTFHELYERAVADWQFCAGTSDRPGAVAGLLERYPREIFPAVTNPALLGFAEAVMGPFVQLDSSVLNCDPPISTDQHSRPVMWHRDRLGSLPAGVYARPASVVFLSYLQLMTDAVGPLRVVPGSHREQRVLSDEELYRPLLDEVLVRASPGDVVAIHHNLLHSGTHNTSDRDRRFFGFIYNLSMIRQEDNFAGPNCRALVDSARQVNDRRLLRLLGEDPLIFPRQNSGFTHEHELDWQRWHSEDASFARETAGAGESKQRVRSDLARPRQHASPLQELGVPPTADQR